LKYFRKQVSKKYKNELAPWSTSPLGNRMSWVRISPGCKVFRTLCTLQCCSLQIKIIPLLEVIKKTSLNEIKNAPPAWCTYIMVVVSAIRSEFLGFESRQVVRFLGLCSNIAIVFFVTYYWEHLSELNVKLFF
jgi:hypothetical protein